jgi:hypothetical protein
MTLNKFPQEINMGHHKKQNFKQILNSMMWDQKNVREKVIGIK